MLEKYDWIKDDEKKRHKISTFLALGVYDAPL